MTLPKRIELQVTYHPAGRRTLKERVVGEQMWIDVTTEGFFGNMDSASFYRAVAKRLASYADDGVVVVKYIDSEN